MATLRPEDEQAEREAADWFAKLNTLSITTNALERFQDWRRVPANDAAYERMEALWEVGGRLQGHPDIQRGVARALNRRAPIQQVLGLWRRPIPRRTGAIALAAGLILAIGISIITVQSGQYRTGVGEQRLVTLEDGTRLRLDTDSRVKVRLGDHERDVELLRGRAFFDVAHDTSRPFIVHADGTAVRALGTRFDVRLTGNAVKVTLVEGSVEVTQADRPKAWRLAPGETLSPRETAAQPKRVDVAATTSWTSGRLTFRETPLAQAVAEVNRYSRRKVVVDVARLQQVPVNGVFDVGDTEAFVAAVSDLFELTVEPKDSEIRLTPKG
jgi:transmembrane sensor